MLQLGDNGSLGSEQISCPEDELTMFPAIMKEQLELFVIRTFNRLIQPRMESLVRNAVIEGIESFQVAQRAMMRNSENGISVEKRRLKLKFLNKVSHPVFTGKKIKGEDQSSIGVALVDDLTGLIVESGPAASAKVEFVVVEAEFHGDEGSNWTCEEFEKNIIREKDGKKSLLAGKVSLNLKKGIGHLGEVSFTHNSTWMKRGKYRLGVRVVDEINGVTIKEATTEAFTVKDRRGELYKKHYPPSLSDDVRRIEKIGKHLHKRLTAAKIENVKDFLIQLNTNPGRLKDIFGTAARMWDTTVSHAQTCFIDNKLHLYCSPNFEQKTGVVFNEVGQLLGVVFESQYIHVDFLWEDKKKDAQKLVVSAFEHWDHVQFFESEASLKEEIPYLFDVSTDMPPVIENPMENNLPGTCQWFVDSFNTPSPGILSPTFNTLLRSSSFNGCFGSPIFDPSFYIQHPSPGSSYHHLNENDDLGPLDNNCVASQPENPSGDQSLSDQQSGGNGHQRKAQRRWQIAILSIRKRIVAVGGSHIRKKQRLL